MSTNKCLVIGAPRSGTSLLAGMIGAHPDVGMLREDYSGAMGRIVGKKVAGNKLCIPNQISFGNSWWNRLLRRYGFHLYRGRSVVSLEEYLVDPQLVVVAIVRRPYAVINSMCKRGGQSRSQAYRRWARSIEILSEVETGYSEKLLIVPFELLVESPRATIDAVATHLNLPFYPAMLQGHEHTSSYDHENKGIDPERAQVNEKLKQRYPVHENYPGEVAMYHALRERNRSKLVRSSQ